MVLIPSTLVFFNAFSVSSTLMVLFEFFFIATLLFTEREYICVGILERKEGT